MTTVGEARTSGDTEQLELAIKQQRVLYTFQNAECAPLNTELGSLNAEFRAFCSELVPLKRNDSVGKLRQRPLILELAAWKSEFAPLNSELAI